MKAKRIAIGLGIAVTTILAVVVGVLGFNKGGKTEPQIFAQPHNQGLVAEEFKPTTYYFDDGEVRMAKGSDRLVYSYDVNQTASAPVAYEYVFKNSLSTEMAVNIKEIEVTGATVSYQWSDTKLDEITQSESHFITQPISSNGAKYLYVVLTPEDEDVSVVVDTEIKWNYGEAGNITKIHTVSGLPFTQTYIKNMPINEEDMLLPNMEEGYAFGGWYWDADYVQPVQFPLAYSGKQMYARVGSPLPDDWYGTYTSSISDPYYQKYGVITTGTPLSTLKSQDIIIPEVHNGQEVKLINVTLTDATNIRIPDTMEKISYAFQNNTSIKGAYIPKSVKYTDSTFRSCTNLTKVVFEEGFVGYISSCIFQGCKSLTSISIPEGVTVIGSYAFDGCYNLSDVTIPSTITEIGGYAFYNCSALTNISIPDCVTSIGGYSFNGCKSLVAIKIPSALTSLGSAAFQNCSSLTGSIIIPEGITRINSSVFANCTKISYISIPSSVSYIDSYAFSNCDGITEMTVPANLTTLGSNVFSNCDNLVSVIFEDGCKLTSIPSQAFEVSNIRSIIIPENVTKIGDYAFRGCKSLTSLEFAGDKLTTIGKQAFSDSSSLYRFASVSGTLVIPASVTTIGDHAFKSNKIENLIFEPNSKLTTIGQYAFGGNKIQNDVIIPDSVTSLGSSAFSANLMQRVYIGSGITTVSSSAFSSCKNLTEVTFSPDTKVTSIGSSAFSHCEKLETITIPASVQTIGSSAFGYCYNLSSFNFESDNTLTTLNSGAFRECYKLSSIDFPSSLTTLDLSAIYYCRGLARIDIPEGVVTVTGSPYDCFGVNTITIPASVTSVSTGVIKEFDNLNSIIVHEDNPIYDSRDNCNALIETATNTLIVACGSTIIPNGVTSIGTEAFASCTNFVNIVIPDSVTSIGNSAFSRCTKLENVIFSKNLISIGAKAFYGCTELLKVELPEGVTSIGTDAFRGCSKIKSIIIPSTITSIADNAFNGCSQLKTVYNLSALDMTAGSSTHGYVSYYATNIYNSMDGTQSIAFTITYTEVDGGLAVTGYTGTPTEVVLDSRTIRIDSKAFYDCDTLRIIRIPASVQTIGSEAFYSCGALRSVLFEDGSQLTGIREAAFRYSSISNINLGVCTQLKSITADYVFSSCESLTQIVIPENLTHFGLYSTFWLCYNLRTVCCLNPSLQLTLGSSSFGRVAEYAEEIIYGTSLVSDEFVLDSVRYYNDGFSIDVIKLDDKSVTNVTIPEGVTEIPSGLFSGCTNLVSVTIPSTVTVIPSNMFKNCVNLARVVFEEGSQLTTIDSNAFYNCLSLVNPVIPDGVTKIAANAFYGCSGITEINLPDSVENIGPDAFNYTNLTGIKLPKNLKSISVRGTTGGGATFGTKLQGKLVIPASVTFIGYRAFYGCNQITEIEFENGSQLTEIYSYAFSDMRNVKTIELPSSLTSLREYAFRSCGLTSVTFEVGPNSLSIGDYVFSANNITNLVLPKRLSGIGKYAFSGIIGGKVVIPSAVTTISNYAFSGGKFTELLFEAGLQATTIGSYAFYQCTEISSVTIPANVKTINTYAFQKCSNLKHLSFAGNSKLQYIKDYAFQGCNLQGTLVLPSGLLNIGASAFSDCNLQGTLVLPSGLLNIGASAFSGCNLQGTLVLPSGLLTIGASAFSGNSQLIGKLIIPASVTSIGSDAFNRCCNFTGIVVESGNTVYDSRDNCNAIIETATGALLKGCNMTSTIPSGVTSIANNAFRECANLVKISIPASVTSIGEYAFNSCSKLTTVTIESNSQLTTIGGYSFQNCSSLQGITIPASVTSIGSAAFNITNGTFKSAIFEMTEGWKSGSKEISATDLVNPATAATTLTNNSNRWTRS